MKSNILKILKENISHFAGIDQEKILSMERMLKKKKEQLELYNYAASEYIIKHNIPIEDTVPSLVNGKYIYGNSKYQEIMDKIEILRKEIEQIEESHLMKIHNRKR
ncbi:MAG: hypothetical protein IJO57_01235 [Bacilli bacterium]|nr:hypothetical protein [Bacilli bacterium]